jgi:hypothetical protein
MDGLVSAWTRSRQVSYVNPPGPQVRVIRYNENDGKPAPGMRAPPKEKKPNSPLFSVQTNFDQEGNLYVSPSAGTVAVLQHTSEVHPSQPLMGPPPFPSQAMSSRGSRASSWTPSRC